MSEKISALTALDVVKPDDVIPLVDIHDETMASSGTTKKITVADLLGLAPSGDSTGATDYANITGLLSLSGSVMLQPGTFYTNATISMTADQTLSGAGVGETILTASTDIVLIQMGNEQSDHTMRNWMRLSNMTVNQTGGTQTHANVKIDGGGRGTSIRAVSTGGGKYGFELMDLDRCQFEDISANNPGTAGIFLEVGYQNTYGTVTFVNCDTVLSSNGTYGFYVGANADQGSPNQPDRLSFIGCMMYMSNGLTGCVGFYDTIGLTSANFIGCLFEQNSRQFRTDGSGSSVNFLGCTFLDSTNACTDIAYLNGGGSFSFRDCRFQQATNCFNAVSNSPKISLEGRNNNQGNITNLFNGSFGGKFGTDTVFAGDNILALGLNNQRFGYGFINNLVGNPVNIFPSGDGAGAINFLKANGSTVVGSFNTTTGVWSVDFGTDTSAAAAVSSPTFISGTAMQVSTTQDVELYIAIQTSAALAVAIGPTSATATTIMPSQSYALGCPRIKVPKDWYVKITGTIADLTITAVTC